LHWFILHPQWISFLSARTLVVLQLQFPQSLGLSGVHAAILGSPLVKAGITEAVFAANLFDRYAGFGLPQNRMICSSLYLLVLMSITLRVDGLLGKITGAVYGEQVTLRFI
jgi:hypothetical protein